MKTGKVILVIDDDQDDRDIFSEVLQEIDPSYICVWGCDGNDGISKLKEMDEPPAYIFLDLNMPRMNGKQCLASIRKLDGFKDIPVVIYSTSKLDSDMEEVKNLGATYFLTKPSIFNELKSALQIIFTGNHAENNHRRNFLQIFRK